MTFAASVELIFPRRPRVAEFATAFLNWSALSALRNRGGAGGRPRPLPARRADCRPANGPAGAAASSGLSAVPQLRRRRQAAAAAILLLLVAGLWLSLAARCRAREVVYDLRDIAEAHRRSDWVAADRALDRADLRLGSSPGFTDLRRGLDDARHESKLAQRLESIRMARSMGFSRADADRIEADFALAFREARLIDTLEPPDLVAARLRRMNILRCSWMRRATGRPPCSI